MKTYINLNVYNLRLKNGKWYKTLFMQLLKMMVCQNWAYINSFLNNLFIKHHFTLIVVNGCMVCPTTVSLLILSSRSKTSSSNLLLFNFRLCLLEKEGVELLLQHKVMCYFLPFWLTFSLSLMHYNTRFFLLYIISRHCGGWLWLFTNLWDQNYINLSGTLLFNWLICEHA